MDRELNSVWNLAEPLAQSMGYELLKVEFAVEHGSKVLRVYLDKAGGIVLEDCENFSQALGPALDVEANVEGSYHLEVSSPGLDRPLSKLAHYAAQLGNIVHVTTEEPIDGRRNFKGELLKAEEEGGLAAIEIQVDQNLFRLELDGIKKANLDYFASEAKRLKDASSKGRKKGREA